MKKFLFQLVMAFLVFFAFTTAAFALAQEPDPVSSAAIVSLFSGAAVWASTELVKKISGLSGNMVLFLIVPVLSLLLGWVTTLIDSSSSVWINAFIGLGSVFLDNAITRLKEG